MIQLCTVLSPGTRRLGATSIFLELGAEVCWLCDCGCVSVTHISCQGYGRGHKQPSRDFPLRQGEPESVFMLTLLSGAAPQISARPLTTSCGVLGGRRDTPCPQEPSLSSLVAASPLHTSRRRRDCLVSLLPRITSYLLSPQLLQGYLSSIVLQKTG